jgi:dTDP-4-amino-4,6-dideoxygalactose transaminase
LPAALGTARLRFLEGAVASRTRNAATIATGLTQPRVRELPVLENSVSSHYSMVLMLSFKDNARFLDWMAEHCIPSDVRRFRIRALYEAPLLASHRRPCPHAERLLSSVTTVPVHGGISQRQLEYIIETVNSYRERA